MSGDISFFDTTASSQGIKIGGVRSYQASGNAVETIPIPGRIGAVVQNDEQQIENEIREYKAALYLRNAPVESVEEAFTEIRRWLLEPKGYQTLTDTYEPSYYRKAFFVGNFTPERKGARQNFEFPLTFSCEPKRYIAGVQDEKMTINGDAQIEIGTAGFGRRVTEKAKPMIKIVGTGSSPAFVLNFLEIASGTEYGSISFAAGIPAIGIYFDADTLSASSDPYGWQNANQYVTDVSGEIYLAPSRTIVQRTSTANAVVISPRWWVR